ncbi:MAG: hypothetical protein QNJ58_17205 [Desulfobacterales bacterium]|nr:hypothetical protein [Desulfobacterales bacterium]
MAIGRKQMFKVLKAIQEPRLVPESDFQGDGIIRVISGEGGYCLDVEEVYIDGPFYVSENEYDEIPDMDEDSSDFMDSSEDQLEMIEAGCEPGIAYFRYQNEIRKEGPVFSEDRNELESILIGDVMDVADCQTWDDMSTSELEEWYEWMEEAP